MIFSADSEAATAGSIVGTFVTANSLRTPSAPVGDHSADAGVVLLDDKNRLSVGSGMLRRRFGGFVEIAFALVIGQ